MAKVLIIGLDGATLDLVRPWAKENKLPHLRRLMESGTWAPLESTLPPMTSPAWPSFATGKYPASTASLTLSRPSRAALTLSTPPLSTPLRCGTC